MERRKRIKYFMTVSCAINILTQNNYSIQNNILLKYSTHNKKQNLPQTIIIYRNSNKYKLLAV